LTFQFQVDSQVVTVNFLNKKHIKHCYLRVLDKDLLEIKANIFFTQNDAKRLLNSKKEWIKKQIKSLENKALNENEFLYLGQIKRQDAYKISNLDKFYKDEIQKILPSMVEKYSNIMKLYPTSIKYRKNKRTWGSCNHKNGLNFNILLMKFPLEVMEYVVIHELAHIKHKNHSSKFWGLVQKYCPDYKQRENLLKSFL